MDTSFWHERWQIKDIGFHEGEANAFLVTHVAALKLMPGARIFLPLCGKTRDIAWLLSQGYQVVGIELSEIAVRELFSELEIEADVVVMGQFMHFHAKDIDIYVGDYFDLTQKQLGPIDAVYDRAALVALPLDTRKRYTHHLQKISGRAPQLLICYEYDQSQLEGPPFSISQQEIRQHYANSFDITLLEQCDVEGCIRGQVEAEEGAWLLLPIS